MSAADAGFAGVGPRQRDQYVPPARSPEQESEAVRRGAPRSGADNSASVSRAARTLRTVAAQVRLLPEALSYPDVVSTAERRVMEAGGARSIGPSAFSHVGLW